MEQSQLWSIMSSKGEQLSTNLPLVVRSFEDFIKVDVWTGDSDPVYWAVNRAADEFDPYWATRFCVAMLAYYHTGTAARAADYEGVEFWDYLNSIYTAAPRASERRHFRGVAGREALRRMQVFSPVPEDFFALMPDTYKGIKKKCEDHLFNFGPYFQLKICDYMDRCLDIPIRSMAGLETNLPRDPGKAILLHYPLLSPSQGFLKMCERVSKIGLLAAPTFDRPVGPAEVETSLCGWKTTLKGNWFGADVADKRASLVGYGDKALRMIEWMPRVPPKAMFKLELSYG